MNLNEIPAWSDIESQPWFAELTPEEKQQSLTKWQGDMMSFAKDPKEKFAVAATSKAKARSFFGEEMPDDPIADALQRRQKDLEDIGSRYDAFSKGELEEDDEEVLTLNDTLKGNTPYSVIKGRLFVSPQLVWDKAAYEKVVNEAPVDEDERVLAMSAYDGSKERAAEGVVNSLGYTDEAFRDFAAKGFKEGKSNAAILDEWKANNKLPDGILGSLRGVGRQAYFGLRSGLSGLERAMGGLGGFFGSESAQKYAEESGKEAQSYMQRTLGEGPEFIGELTSGAVSIIPTMAAGAAASLFTEGAALPAAASVTAGAIQSAGATQAETYEFYRNQGLDHANALAESRVDGLVSGLITGAITHYAGKLGDKIGLGKGIEGLFSGPASKIASKLTQREISESLKAGAKAVGGSFLQEGSEELLDTAAQDAYSMIKRDPTLTLAEAINNALQAGKVGAVLGGAAEAGKIGLNSLLNSAKFAVPTTEEEEALRAKFEVPAAVEEEVIASPEVQQEEQNIKTAADVVKEAAPVAPQTAAVLAGIAEEKAGELAADVVGATEEVLADIEAEAPLVVDETPLVSPKPPVSPASETAPISETPAVTTAPLAPIPTEETQPPQGKTVETPTNAAPEIPLEESLRQEPQDRVEVRTPEETGVGDSVQRAAEGEKEVGQDQQKFLSDLQFYGTARLGDNTFAIKQASDDSFYIEKTTGGQRSTVASGFLDIEAAQRGAAELVAPTPEEVASTGQPPTLVEEALPERGASVETIASGGGMSVEEARQFLARRSDSGEPLIFGRPFSEISGMQQNERPRVLQASDKLRAVKQVVGDINKFRIPVSQDVVNAYGITLPSGYVKQGDLYVFQPPSPPTTGAVPTETLPDGQKVTPRGVASPAVEAAPEPAPEAQPEQPDAKEKAPTEPSESTLSIAKRFGGRIAWSQGDLAIIEGFQLFGSKSLYVAVVGDRYSLTDFTLMKPEQRKALLGDNEELFLRKREEIVEANNRMLAQNPDGPFTNGQTVVVSKNVPQNVASVFREWVRLLGLGAPTRIVLTTPQDGIDMAAEYGGKFRRIGVTSLMSDNERGQMTPLGEDDFHIFYKEDASYARTLEVLAHELGHILERQSFKNLPDDQRKAIIAEHEKWLKRVGSQKALDGIRELRSMRVGKIHPNFGRADDRFDSLNAYWKSFSEWFADQVARWATTTDKPLTVIEKFFARLGKKLREFFNLKGSQFAPNQRIADWLNSLSPDLNAVVEETLAPAEPATKDSLPVVRDTTKPEQMTPLEYMRKAVGAKFVESVAPGKEEAWWSAKEKQEAPRRYAAGTKMVLEENGRFFVLDLNTNKYKSFGSKREAFLFFKAKGGYSERRYIEALSGKKLDPLSRIDHKIAVDNAVKNNAPVSAETVDAYGIKLPEGYVKQGELYVYEKTQPLPKDDTAGERGAVAPAPTVEPAPEAQPEQPVSQPVQSFRDAVSQMTPTAQAKWTPELRATAEAYLDSGGTTGLQGLSDVQQKVVGRFLPEEVKAAFDAEDARKRAQRNKLPDHRESSLPPTPGKQIRKIGKGAMESVPVVLDEIAKVIPNIRELVEVRESVEGEPDAEGFYDPQADKAVVLVDNVYLKPQHGGSQEAALRETIIHELLHRGFAKLRQTNPQLFEQFEAYSLADTNDAQFEALVRRGYSMYSNWKDDPAQNQKAREEIFIRKAVVDLNFKGIEAVKSPSSLASQFFSWLRGLLNKLLGRKVDDETLLHWSRVFLNAAQADFIEKTPGERMHAFAGEKAIENLPEERRQFMRDSLETAKAMAAAGKDSEEIRAVTGWFPGKYDGKMRWEVPDEGAKLKNINAATLGELLEYPSLFETYPSLADVEVYAGPQNSYSQADDSISLRDFNVSTVLHEVQHAIQKREGFAKGGDSRMAFADPRMGLGSKKGLAAANRILQEVLTKMGQPLSIEAFAKQAWQSDVITDEIKQSYADYVATTKRAASDPGNMQIAQETASKEWYRSLAGEIEARDIQARQNFTPEQRAATAPYSSENIAKEDAIVMFGGGGDQRMLSLSPPTPDMQAEADALREVTPSSQALDKFRETFGTPRQDVGQVLGKKEGSVYTQAQVAPLSQHARNVIGFDVNEEGDPVVNPKATQKALDLVSKLLNTKGYASRFNTRAAKLFEGMPVDPEIASAVLVQELQAYANRLSASSPKAEDQILKAALTPFYNTVILGNYLTLRTAGRALQAAGHVSGTDDARKSREEAEKAVNKEITKQLGDEALPAAEGMDKAGVEGGVDAIKDDIPAPADPTLRLLDLAVESLDEVAKADANAVFDVLLRLGEAEEALERAEKVGNKAMSILTERRTAQELPSTVAELKVLVGKLRVEAAEKLAKLRSSLEGAKPETKKKVKEKAAKAGGKAKTAPKVSDKEEDPITKEINALAAELGTLSKLDQAGLDVVRQLAKKLVAKFQPAKLDALKDKVEAVVYKYVQNAERLELAEFSEKMTADLDAIGLKKPELQEALVAKAWAYHFAAPTKAVQALTAKMKSAERADRGGPESVANVRKAINGAVNSTEENRDAFVTRLTDQLVALGVEPQAAEAAAKAAFEYRAKQADKKIERVMETLRLGKRRALLKSFQNTKEADRTEEWQRATLKAAFVEAGLTNKQAEKGADKAMQEAEAIFATAEMKVAEIKQRGVQKFLDSLASVEDETPVTKTKQDNLRSVFKDATLDEEFNEAVLMDRFQTLGATEAQAKALVEKVAEVREDKAEALAEAKRKQVNKVIDATYKRIAQIESGTPSEKAKKQESLRNAVGAAIKAKEFDEAAFRASVASFGASEPQAETLVQNVKKLRQLGESKPLSKAKLRQFLLSFPKNVLANPEQREALLRSFLKGQNYSETEINRIVPQVLRDFDTGYQKARKAYLDELEKKLKPKQGQKESKQDQQNRKMLNALRSGLADTTSETSVALAKSLGFEAFRPQDDHILSKLDEEMRKLREQDRISDANAKFVQIRDLLNRRRPPRDFMQVAAQGWITSALSSLSNFAVNVWAPLGEAGVRFTSDILRAAATGRIDEIPLYLEAAIQALKSMPPRAKFAFKTDTFTNSVNTLIADMASMKDELQRALNTYRSKDSSKLAKAAAAGRILFTIGDLSRRVLSTVDDTWYTALSSYIGSSNLIKDLRDAKLPKAAVQAIAFHANNDAIHQAQAEHATLDAVSQFVESLRGKTEEEIDAGLEYLGLNDASVTQAQADYIQEIVSALQSLRIRSGATGDDLVKRALKEISNFKAAVNVRAVELGQARTKELLATALTEVGQTPQQIEEAQRNYDENAKKAASFGMGLHRVEGVPSYDIMGKAVQIVDAMGRGAVTTSPLLGRMMVGFFGIPLNLLNKSLWFTPYGLGRYFLAKWQMAKNPEEKFYEYSMSSQREMSQRVNEIIIGHTIMAAAFALGAIRDQEDEEGEGLYITLGGPSNKTEYDAWYARGFRKFSFCYKTKDGSVAAVPYGRGMGEVLKMPLMLLGAFDDMRLNKKLGDREDMSSIIEYLNSAAAGIGNQATFLGAKNTVGAFAPDKIGANTASSIAYAVSNLVPFNGLDRSIAALAVGPPDRSRTGAILANIPIARWLATDPAINVFGDKWGNKSDANFAVLWDRQWNQGLIPLNISAPLTGQDKRLYGFIGERLIGPSPALRGALELRNGYVTDKQWYDYSIYRGQALKREMVTQLDRLRRMDDDSLSKAIAELSTKATKKAKDRFNYK